MVRLARTGPFDVDQEREMARPKRFELLTF